jgi:hypothetical protein
MHHFASEARRARTLESPIGIRCGDEDAAAMLAREVSPEGQAVAAFSELHIDNG